MGEKDFSQLGTLVGSRDLFLQLEFLLIRILVVPRFLGSYRNLGS
jgi:hypothetical protein